MASTDLPIFDNKSPSFELTSPQQGIWFDQITHPELPYYNIGMLLKIKGKLDIPLFEKAFQLVVDRHESLRLVLSVQDGNVRQTLMPDVKSKLGIVEFSGEQAGEQYVKAYLQDAFCQPFNLLGEALWEARLVCCGPEQYYLLHRSHHLICDGVTVYLLIRAIADAYNGLLQGDDNPPLGNSYLSFLAEDRAYLASPRFERDKAFWKALYAELPPPVLQPRIAVADSHIAVSALSQMMIPRHLFNRLAQFARGKGLSLPHIFMSIISTYFCRTSGVDTLVIGMPVHNRTTAYQKNTAGMFSSLNPIRIEVDPEASFLELMQTTSATLRRSYRHQHFPIAELNRLLEEEIQHQRQQVAGLLRIELPVLFGREQVMPVLLQLAQQYPQLLLSVNFTNNLSQLAENALDLAVRIGQLPDTHNLTARALGIQDMVICASPACLAQYGQPVEASALQQLPCLTENPQAQWQLFNQQGELRLITPQIRMAIKDVSALTQACLAGFGFARLPEWLVAEQINQGLLIPVLQQSLPAGPPIHLIWDTNRFISMRMRVVIDALTEHFSQC